LYQSFDAIDGKQARRTGTSGPLGELFDHGCDALNTSLGAILATAATGLGHSWWMVAGLFAAHVNFYLNTWEEYHTGTLYLSFFSGPVEGVILMVISFLMTGYYGPIYWSQGWKTALGIHGLDAVPNVQMNHLLFLVSLVVMVSNASAAVSNVVAALRKEGKPILPAMMRMLPLFPHMIMTTIWLKLSPRVLEHRMVYVTLYLGFAFSFQVGRMIVSYVTKYRYPRTNILLLPLGIWVTNLLVHTYAHFTVIPLEYENAWIYGSLAYGFGVYMDFALSVINDICAYFDIYCLSIKHKKETKVE
jgi:ethanolaminephosphotransferase